MAKGDLQNELVKLLGRELTEEELGLTVPDLNVRIARIERDGAPDPASEVRPEEIAAGVGAPVTTSAWSPEVIAELEKPLDPGRVRIREGKYEYLAGHDVKRRASQIFGFGNWGHRVRSLDEIGAVEVVSKSNKPGWHVAYRCVVSVWVRVVDLDGRRGDWESDGVGYGDGVEYTAAARVKACELAIKEAETDALKRAFTDLGDQFGLILYAKDDEKRRIARDQDVGETDSAREPVRRDPEPAPPRNFQEIHARLAHVLGSAPEEATAWLGEAVAAAWKVEKVTDLTGDARILAGQKLAGVVLDLEDLAAKEGDLGFLLGKRDAVARIFAARLDGIGLAGPPWRLGPDEPTFPTREEALAAFETKEDGGSTESPPEGAGAPEQPVESASGADPPPLGPEEDIPFDGKRPVAETTS